jgi:inactivated superfamily I helicase
VFEFVTSNFTREPVVALLGSPHFSFEVDGPQYADQRSPGSTERSPTKAISAASTILGRSRDGKAAKAAVAAAAELAPLAESERPSVQLDALLAFVRAHDRVPEVGDPLRERHLRARSAVLSAIHGLRRAHQYLDDAPVEFSTVAAMIRRWIEGQTFSPRAGQYGVQLIDAQAARYGEFDEVFLVGLVEGEWPAALVEEHLLSGIASEPARLPDSRMALAGERAAFHDLMALARRHVHLSTFELENDSIVGPSVFLEDADRIGFREERTTRWQPGPHVCARSARA